ncbi:MFS transporter [Krasilnikovia sp. MM14-A1259]|uniref:MFS transporter n=1 Tax=Krasilnikovia sp. MM14-A1259 TaxID=3373539 RepID=UPI00382BDB31
MPLTNARDVYLVAGSRAVSVCGDFLAATTLALVLQQAGHGGVAVSGLTIAAALPIALLAPLAGRVVDRVDSRTLLVVVGFLQAAVCGLLAYVSSPVLIVALVAVLASGLAFTQPTFGALVPEMVRPDEFGRASALVQTAGQIGMLSAPALAGLLVGHAGARPALLLDAASYLALVGAGMLIRTRRRPDARRRTTVVTDRGWRVRDDRTLLVMIAALAAACAGVSLINVVDVFFVRETLGASPVWYGVITASWTAGQLIATPFVGRVDRNRVTVPLMLLVTAGASVAILAIAAVPSAAWMLVPMTVGGLFNAGINIFSKVILVDRAPSEHRGKAFATLSASVQGAMLAGLLAAGPLVDRFEPRLLVLVSGVGGVFATAVAYPVARARRAPSVTVVPDDLPPREDSVDSGAGASAGRG